MQGNDNRSEAEREYARAFARKGGKARAGSMSASERTRAARKAGKASGEARKLKKQPPQDSKEVKQ